MDLVIIEIFFNGDIGYPIIIAGKALSPQEINHFKNDTCPGLQNPIGDCSGTTSSTLIDSYSDYCETFKPIIPTTTTTLTPTFEPTTTLAPTTTTLLQQLQH